MRFKLSEVRSFRSIEKEENFDPAALLGSPPEYVAFRHPVHAHATATMTGTDVVVNGRVDTVVTFNCGRCLTDFEKPVKGDFQEVFSGGDDEIVVDEEIRETVLLDVPIRAICREECLGICASCGANRNSGKCNCPAESADPRWAGLKNFPFK
jgi:uncharacterized protein